MKILLVAAMCLTTLVASASVIVDFDGLWTSGSNDYDFPGSDGTHDWYQSGIGFSRTVSYGGFAWDGITYSGVNDTTTPGYGNQYSVYGSGTDRSGTGSYAVFYQPFVQRSMVTLPIATQVNGFYANNTSYAALAMLNGEAPARAFTAASNDWFKLTIEGFDSANGSLGTVDFMLADYSQGSEDLVDDWRWVDLSALGTDVKSLSFALTSTDNGTYGMNTPSYFAMDELSIEAIPEPSSVILLAVGFGGMAAFRKNRKYILR